MRRLQEKTKQPEHSRESFQEQRSQALGTTGSKEGASLARWAWMGFPATTPAIFQVPKGATEVWPGSVPGEAGSGHPVAFCLDKHAPAVPVDCHLLWAPRAALTLAHCSSSDGSSGALAPHPYRQQPQHSLTCLHTLCRSGGSVLPPW